MKNEIEKALLEIMRKQHACLAMLNNFASRGVGMTQDELRELGVLVQEVNLSIKYALEQARK